MEITVEALVVHESSGCPSPDVCPCEGQWPFFPKWGLIYDHQVQGMRRTTQQDLDNAAAKVQPSVATSSYQGTYPSWWTAEKIKEYEDTKQQQKALEEETNIYDQRRKEAEEGKYPSSWTQDEIDRHRRSVQTPPEGWPTGGVVIDAGDAEKNRERVYPMIPKDAADTINNIGPLDSMWPVPPEKRENQMVEHITLPVPEAFDIDVDTDEVVVILRYQSYDHRVAATEVAAEIVKAHETQ